jgi:cytochrome c peroxidase
VEFLVELYTPAAAKQVNGPALPRVAEDDPTQTVIPPEGFQVIEELLFPALDPAPARRRWARSASSPPTSGACASTPP